MLFLAVNGAEIALRVATEPNFSALIFVPLRDSNRKH